MDLIYCALDFIDVSVLHCHLMPSWYPWPMSMQMSMLLPEAVLISIGHDATEVHINVDSLCSHLRPGWCLWAGLPLGTILVLLACAVPGHIDVCVLCCSKGPCWCPWSVLPMETMLRSLELDNSWDHWMSVILDVSRCHVEIHDPYSHECKGQGSYFYSGITDCILTVEKKGHRRLLWQPRTHTTHPKT